MISFGKGLRKEKVRVLTWLGEKLCRCHGGLEIVSLRLRNKAIRQMIMALFL